VGRRWILGHVSTLSDRDVERIARMGLVVSTHTNRYVYKEGHVLQQSLPPERAHEISPLRALVDAGVHVSLATDNVPVSLFWPIWQSVSRESRYTGERIAPAQALTREQALRCATIEGAYLTNDEDRKGSLEAGKLADLVVLDADPLQVAESALREVGAVLTMVGGVPVYASAGYGDLAAERAREADAT
jgi:predicted amidohydrolase YtcJ